MTKKTWKDKIRDKIQNGRYEEYKGLSICKINDFYQPMNRKVRYQVHSYRFSGLFEDIEEALDKFFEIKRKIR
jgi:hypothetical protein|tara:strand:- start:16506 stop:16724 length:219 start_codon:yes stop_codon:yes gene_type:complete